MSFNDLRTVMPKVQKGGKVRLVTECHIGQESEIVQVEKLGSPYTTPPAVAHWNSGMDTVLTLTVNSTGLLPVTLQKAKGENWGNEAGIVSLSMTIEDARQLQRAIGLLLANVS